jgi:hypothetical protein
LIYGCGAGLDAAPGKYFDEPDPCRSELARDGLKGNAFIQTARVIVDVHREQARSYRGWVAGNNVGGYQSNAQFFAVHCRAAFIEDV